MREGRLRMRGWFLRTGRGMWWDFFILNTGNVVLVYYITCSLNSRCKFSADTTNYWRFSKHYAWAMKGEEHWWHSAIITSSHQNYDATWLPAWWAPRLLWRPLAYAAMFLIVYWNLQSSSGIVPLLYSVGINTHYYYLDFTGQRYYCHIVC